MPSMFWTFQPWASAAAGRLIHCGARRRTAPAATAAARNGFATRVPREAIATVVSTIATGSNGKTYRHWVPGLGEERPNAIAKSAA